MIRTGNAGSNFLFGSAGSDHITGQGGNDLMVGLGGEDVFVFRRNENRFDGDDVIFGFGEGDLLRFEQVSHREVVWREHPSGLGTVVEYGGLGATNPNHGSIFLFGVHEFTRDMIAFA